MSYTQTGWSEWQFFQENNRWYRSRTDENGNPQYQWDDPNAPIDYAPVDSTPRTDLEDNFRNFNLNDSVSYAPDPGSDYDYAGQTRGTQGVDSEFQDPSPATHSDTSTHTRVPREHREHRDRREHRDGHNDRGGSRKEKGKERRRRKDKESGKGKEPVFGQPDDPFYGSSGPAAYYGDQPNEQYAEASRVAADEGVGASVDNEAEDAGYAHPQSDYHHSAESQEAGGGELEPNEALRQATDESRRTYDQQQDPFLNQGGPSTSSEFRSSAYGMEPSPAAAQYSYGPANSPIFMDSSHGTAYSDPATTYVSSADEGYQQPAYDPDYHAQSGQLTTGVDYADETVVGTGGDYEQLDPRYRVNSSKAFQPGEVFKVLWSEPKGGGGQNMPDVDSGFTDIRTFKNHLGELFYVGIRRFIIIGTDEGNSTCIPISTYGRKACGKRGVKPKKHGIIYDRKRPKLLKDEPELGFAPVRLSMYAHGEVLSPESRVNYAKLVTVEHNVKVFFIGRLEGVHFDAARDAVDDCWQKKLRHREKK